MIKILNPEILENFSKNEKKMFYDLTNMVFYLFNKWNSSSVTSKQNLTLKKIIKFFPKKIIGAFLISDFGNQNKFKYLIN